MARGKHGAAATTRRAANELDQAREELARSVDRERQLRAQVAELQAEVQRIRSRVLAAAQELAAEQIEHARAAAAEDARGVADASRARKRAVVEAIGRAHKGNEIRATAQVWHLLADVLGVTVGELIDPTGAVNRNKRRRGRLPQDSFRLG